MSDQEVGDLLAAQQQQRGALQREMLEHEVLAAFLHARVQDVRTAAMDLDHCIVCSVAKSAILTGEGIDREVHLSHVVTHDAHTQPPLACVRVLVCVVISIGHVI